MCGKWKHFSEIVIFHFRRENEARTKEEKKAETRTRAPTQADVSESECYINLSLYDTVSVTGARAQDDDIYANTRSDVIEDRKRPIVKPKPRVARHRLYLEHSYENVAPNVNQSQSLAKQMSTICKLSFKQRNPTPNSVTTSPDPPERTVSLPAFRGQYLNGRCVVCNKREPASSVVACCGDVTRRPSEMRIIDNDVYIGDDSSETDV